jgi:hypothetical protein
MRIHLGKWIELPILVLNRATASLKTAFPLIKSASLHGQYLTQKNRPDLPPLTPLVRAQRCHEPVAQVPLMHHRARWCIADPAVLSAMPVVLFPLPPADPAYRLSLCKTPLLTLGDKPAFLLCISQDTFPHHLFSESAQKFFLRFTMS